MPYTLNIGTVFKGNATTEQQLIPQKSDMQEAAGGEGERV